MKSTITCALKTVEAEWKVEKEFKWLTTAVIIVTIPSALVILVAIITGRIQKRLAEN